jgi:hypothetical protein
MQNTFSRYDNSSGAATQREVVQTENLPVEPKIKFKQARFPTFKMRT